MGTANPSAGTIPDLTTNCFPCRPVQGYVDLTTDLVDKVSVAFNNPLLIVFSSLAVLWVVTNAGKLAIGMTDTKKIGHDFIYITISCALLGGQSVGLVSYIFNLSMDIMGGTSEAIFSAIGVNVGSTGYSGLVHLVATGSEAMARVMQVASAIARAGSLYNFANYLYALIIFVPFFILAVAYACQVIVAVFRLMMYAILSSMYAMAYGFDWGRSIASSTARGTLGAIVVMVACTTVLSLVVFGVTRVDIDPTAMSSGELNEFASFSNAEFLVILMLGIAGSALMTEGTSLVNSSMQTMFSNAAAGIMTGGVTAVAALAAKKANPLTLGSRYADMGASAAKNIGGYAAMGSHALSAAQGIGSGIVNGLSRPAAAQDFLNRYRGGAN